MNHENGTNFSIIYGAAALIFWFAAPAMAQDVSVKATVDSSNIMLGDWIHVTVEAKHPSSVPVVWQALRDSIGPFEILRMDTVRAEEANGIITEKRILVVSRYEQGASAIPPICVSYRSGNDTTFQTAESNSIPIDVRGVAVDTTLAIKDLKQPLSVPLSWQEISLYGGIVLLLGALAYGTYRWLKKRQQKIAGIVEDIPAIPPDVLALQQLKTLAEKRVWQSGDVKLFYSEATEIVRRYFEGRYGVAALEMTSDEVLDQLGTCALPKGVMETVRGFLTGADFVKFAKFVPSPSDNERVIPEAELIVRTTKFVPATEPVMVVAALGTAEVPAQVIAQQQAGSTKVPAQAMVPQQAGTNKVPPQVTVPQQSGTGKVSTQVTVPQQTAGGQRNE